MAKLKISSNYGNSYEYFHDRLSKNLLYADNPELFQEDWEISAKTGRLDTFINLLSNTNKITDKNFKENYKWDDFGTTETRLLSLYNEIYKNELETDIIDNYLPKYDKNGNALEIDKNNPNTYDLEKISRYDYNKKIVNENWDIKYQQHLKEVEEQAKKERNIFDKGLATIVGMGGEFVSGFLGQLDNISSTIWGLANGIESLWTEESFSDAYIRAVNSKDMRFAEQTGIIDAIKNFESRYSYLRDTDGNYTTFGKYAGGVTTSLGQMLPSLLVTKYLSGVGASTSMIKLASSATFYSGITTERVRETYNEMALKGASVSSQSILTNAISKSIVEYGIEVILGKILGGSVLDNLVFGRNVGKLTSTSLTKGAGSRLLHDFVSEGLEEVFQDVATYLIDKEIFTRISDISYGLDINGQPLNLSYETLMDSFVIGGLTSIVGSAKNIISTKKVAIGYKTDEKGNLIFDEKGKPIPESEDAKILNKLASWEYGMNMQSFVQNANEIIEASKNEYIPGTKEYNKMTAAMTEMYAAYRMLASVYSSIGEERFQHADRLLTTIAEYEKKGMFDTINLGKFNTILAKESVKSLQTQWLSLSQKSKDKFLKKLEDTKTSNIVQSLTKGEVNALPKNETNDKLKEIVNGSEENKVLVIAEGTTRPINEEGIMVVTNEQINVLKTNSMYADIADQTLITKISEEEKYASYVDQIYYSYKEWKGNSTKEEALYALIVNNEFFSTMLYQANEDMYNFLTSIIQIEKAVVPKDIKTEEYKNKLNNIIENMKKSLIQYLSDRSEVSDQIYNNDLLNDKEIAFVKNQQHNKALYQRLIENGYDKLSENDKNNLNTKINNAPIKQYDKDVITNNLKSADKNTRKSGIDRLNTLYKNIFTSENDGKTYPPQTSVANGAFKAFLKSLNLTIDKLRTRASDSEMQAIIKMFGEFNEDNLISFRQRQFEEAQDNYLTFRYDDKGQIGVFVKESGKQVGYSLYNKFLFENESLYNEDSTLITRTNKHNDEVVKLLNNTISDVYAASLSINDVIMSPNMLKDSIKNDIITKYGKVNSITAYLYLRDYFLNNFKTKTIIVLQNGTFAFGNVENMLRTYKFDYKNKITKMLSKLSDNKSHKLTEFNLIQDKYLVGRLKDINISFTKNNNEWGRYDVISNTIFISEGLFAEEDIEILNHLSFTILHEFQHAIQFENNMNIGANTDIINKLSINDRRKLINSIKKHRPELFVNTNSYNDELEIAEDFIYYSSAESMANGLDASRLIDFFPTIVKYDGKNTVIELPWGDEFSINGYISNSSLIYRNNEKVYNIINKNFIKEYLDFAEKYDKAFNEGLDTNLYKQLDSLSNIKLSEAMEKYLHDSILGEKIDYKQEIVNNITKQDTENSIYKLYKTILDYNNMNNIKNTMSFEEFKNINIPVTRLQRRDSKFIQDDAFVSFNISNINDGFFRDVLYKTKFNKNFDYKYNMFYGTIKLKDCLFVCSYDKTLEVMVKPNVVKHFNKVLIDLSSYEETNKLYLDETDIRRKTYYDKNISNYVHHLMPNINRTLMDMKYTTVNTSYIDSKYIDTNVELINEILSNEKVNYNKDILFDIARDGVVPYKYNEKVQNTIIDYISENINKKFKNEGFYNLLKTNGYNKTFAEFQNDRFVFITNSKFVNEYPSNLIGANIVSYSDNIPFYINNMLDGNYNVGIGTIKGSDIKLFSNNIYNTALIDITNNDITIVNDTPVTSLTTNTNEEVYYNNMVKRSTKNVNDEKKIIYNTSRKGKWIYKVPKVDKEGNVLRDSKGKIIYKPVYDEKTYSNRKVSQKSQKNTNMEKYGYVKKYKQTEMSPSLVKFINKATENIDEVLWNELTKGTLTRAFINEYIYKTNNMSQETFDLINDCFFHNNHIKSFEQLKDLIDKTPDYTAAYIILKDISAGKILESTDTKLYDKAIAIIQTDKTYMNTYLKLIEGFDYWGVGKNRIDIDVDKKGMRYNYLKMFNGTLNEVYHIATIAREAAAFAWHITGKGTGGSGKISLDNNENGGMSNVIGKEDNYSEAMNYLDSVTSRTEMIDKIMEVTSKDIIYKLMSEGKGKNFIATYLFDLRKSYENMSKEMFGREYAKIVDGKSDEEIEKLFHASIVLEQSGIKVDKLNEEQLNNLTENLEELEKQIERPVQAIINNIKGLTRTINNNLAPINHKRFLADNNDLFFVEKGIIKFNTEKFKDNTGKYIDTAQKELFAIEKRVSSLLTNIKEGEYNSDKAKKEKAKLNRLVNKLKAENDILKVKLSGKNAKTKVVKVNDDIVTVEAEKEIPYALQKLLETEFTKTAKTEVQELSDGNAEHIVMNSATFVEDNAEFLNTLNQGMVDELVDFFATSSILPTTNKARQYTLTQIYTMTYLLATTKGNFILSEEQRKTLTNRLEFIVSAGAAIPAAWKQALKILKPEVIIMKSIAKKTGIKFEEETLNKLIINIAKGDIERIKEVKKELYEQGKQQYNNKKKNYREAFLELERMFMLSSPGTGLRNQTSNLLITGLNRVTDVIGSGITKLINKLLPDKYKTTIRQYKITGTKVSKETQEFIKRELIDGGVFALIKDGLNKYTYSKMDKNTTIDNLAYLITAQIESELFNNSAFKNEKLQWLHSKIYKMMSDDPYIQREAIRYLGKILEEDNVDLTKGITKEVLEHIADAYLLAAGEFMHKKNIINALEAKFFERHPNGYFIYKQIFPFAPSSWNWFVEGLNYTPIGLVKSIINYAKLENSITKIVDRKSKGEKLPSTKFTEYIIRKNIGKGVIGSIGMIIGALLVAFKGAGIDEEDEKYKLHIGDVYIDISDIFGTQGIFMGIALTDSLIKDKNGFKALKETFNVMFQDSIYSDFYNLFRYKENFSDFALYVPEQMLNAMIPNFVKTLTAITSKYKVKYHSGILGRLEYLLNQIPLVSYAFPHYIDPYTGEKQVAYKMPFLFNTINKLTPIDISPYNVSDIEKEAIDLGIHKSMLSGQYEVNDKKIKLSPSNIEKLNKFYGQLNKKDLENLYGNKVEYKILDEKTGKYKYVKYSKMTDKEKATIINRIMENNSSLSKIYILTSEYDYKYYANETKYNELIKLGIKNIYKETDKLKGYV